MKLMPKELADDIPELYAAEDLGDSAMVYAKFFTPWTIWTWYVLEYDGSDRCFGLVDGLDLEYGYFLISELESIAGPYGLTIERDLYFEPITVGELRKSLDI